MSDEIPGMYGLCWSDLPLSEEEIEDLKMSGALDDLAEPSDTSCSESGLGGVPNAG